MTEATFRRDAHHDKSDNPSHYSLPDLALSHLPLILALRAGLVAGFNGCTLNEGSVHSCVIFGTDYGEGLQGMMVSAWLLLVTCPAGVILILAYAIIAAMITFFAKRRNKSH